MSRYVRLLAPGRSSSPARRRTAAVAVLVAATTCAATGGTAVAAGAASPSSPAGVRVVPADVEDVVLRSAPRRTGDRRAAAATTEPLTTVPGIPGPPVSDIRVEYVEDSDSTWTSEQKAAYEAAVRTWEGVVVSEVPILVRARMQDLGEADLLGETSPLLLCLQGPDGQLLPDEPCLPSSLMNARDGADVYDGADVETRFNSAFLCDGQPAWSYRLDGQVPPCQTDFQTVVLHELAHGLGFMGSMWVEPGEGGTGSYLVPHDRWDDFVADATGPLLAAGNETTALAARLQAGALRWTGTWGRQANGGSSPALFAPPVFQPGSSYSHLDESSYPAGTSDSLTTPRLHTREVVREPGSLARGLLRDLGWTVTPERADRGVWSSTASTVDVVERRADGSVDLRTWTAGGLSRATLLGGRVKGSPAVVARPSGGLEVFARGTDDALWTRRRAADGAWSAWTSMGGKLTSEPAVSRLSADELHVFVRGTDGAVWTRRSTAPGAWASWFGLGGALAEGSSPSAVSPSSGKLELVTRAPDGSVHRRTTSGRVWGADVSLGGRTLGSPSAASLGGQLLVSAIGADQAVWTRTATSGWSSAGGRVLAGPAVAAAPGSTTAVTFATGTDERLWVRGLTLPGAGAGATPAGWKAGQP